MSHIFERLKRPLLRNWSFKPNIYSKRSPPDKIIRRVSENLVSETSFVAWTINTPKEGGSTSQKWMGIKSWVVLRTSEGLESLFTIVNVKLDFDRGMTYISFEISWSFFTILYEKNWILPIVSPKIKFSVRMFIFTM